ncbi:MAG: ornithine carbamoyltransferase [Deltaproteobacteria bacterium]|nr:ornithine carbamoyltransferase [Deltaproteobacteria bacterium]
MKKDFLSIRDCSPEEIRRILSLAAEIKAEPGKFSKALEGKALAMLFEKPSLRTRVTFDVGIHQLGGFSVLLGPAEINLGKRESLPDVAKNLERMVQGIMVRTFGHDIVEKLAAHAKIPVINGLTDLSHPCQAIGDFQTILEVKGKLEGLKLAFVGDGNNVASSLVLAAALVGMRIAVASPPGYVLRAQVASWARERAVPGFELVVTSDPVEAVQGADVVYTDVWASMGQESEAAQRKAVFLPYQVNETLFARAKPDAIFMHCLPAHRGEEVTDAVIDSPRSVVYQEAENRLHSQKAIMVLLMK